MSKKLNNQVTVSKLSRPITLGSGDLLEEVTVRRVTAGDHRKAAARCKNDPVATEYAVMAMVSGLQQKIFGCVRLGGTCNLFVAFLFDSAS
ncbi:Uncharacterised protein [Avibacterium paragallinarum]|uniref:Uncharacterized protein n=1 Tax=Avibacterium paragallinarum TaxID=728 RepID=A0A377I752_AVIPA|nr:phage tail assembly protein [Avibacterium paragallinarum]STO71013.1 Uncharacterised protein [Avibacterium paragallinarum]